METQRVQMKGVLPGLVPWAGRSGTKDFCPVSAALVSPVQNIFIPHRTLFHFFVPIAQPAGQAAVLGSLVSKYVSLYRAFIFRAPSLLPLRSVPGTDAVLCGNGPYIMYL